MLSFKTNELVYIDYQVTCSFFLYFSYRRATCGLLLSNFGKILVIPAIMWGQKYSTISLWLCNIFTVASNIQAARGI